MFNETVKADVSFFVVDIVVLEHQHGIQECRLWLKRSGTSIVLINTLTCATALTVFTAQIIFNMSMT